MDPPLISHPHADTADCGYPPAHLSEEGHLLLAAHNRAVSEYATRLYDMSCVANQTAAVLHDFGKATPQFQAHVRPAEDYDGADEQKAHARLGALATWYVLGEQDVSRRDRLAATLAVARHHQALPNAAEYTADTLARAFEAGETAIDAQIAAISEAWPEEATRLLNQAPGATVEWSSFAEWARSGEVVSELRAVSARDILGGYDPRPSALPEKLYDRALHIWSALTLADKSHAMDIPTDHIFELDTLEQEAIERYVASLRDDPPEDEHMADLNDDRERARRQTVRGVHEWLAGDEAACPVATLTLPTGLGKTLTGLSAAFEARDILTAPADDCPIVYALPYTSIIEQTKELFEDPALWGADPQTSALTVHHYLSETVVRRDGLKAGDVDDTDAEATAQLLGEAWRDGTVLTTFVQLFESLTGPSNRQGLKLPALKSGLVILDEPQALPKDWWDGIERLLELLTEEYDTRVIAMTATQPTLVRNLDSRSLLAAGREHDRPVCTHCQERRTYETTLPPAARETYFANAERVQYHLHESALSYKPGIDECFVGYGTAADRIHEAATPSGSALAVCNTIGSSRELTRELCDRPGITHLGAKIETALDHLDINGADQNARPLRVVEHVMERMDTADAGASGRVQSGDERVSTADNDRVPIRVLTLNSRYRPFDRRIIIEIADRLSTADTPFVLVSTQAIEAGVDLSFETVFRDLAPLDSIVQAAGRCNRSYEWGRNGGQVTVWTLAAPGEDSPGAPSSKPPAYYVYQQGGTDDGIPGHLRLISEVLADIGATSDISDVALTRDAVGEYFERLAEKSLSAGTLREQIDNAQGRWLAQQSLIGGRETVDILVGQTDAEAEAINQMTELFSVGNPAAYNQLQSASGLRVSLPIDVIESAPTVSRLDGKSREKDGVNVYRFTGGAGLQYDLKDGGLRQSADDVGSRFTI